MVNLTIKNFSNAADLHRHFESYGKGDKFSPAQMEVIYDLFNKCAPNIIIDVHKLCRLFRGFKSIDEAIKAHGVKNRYKLEQIVTVFQTPEGEIVIQD